MGSEYHQNAVAFTDPAGAA